MRLALTGRQLEITPAIRRVVDGKLAKLERMLQDTALSAQVVLTKEKNGYRAEVMLHARGEKILHGVGMAEVIQVSVGGAVDKISQQAQKVKGKWLERKRHGRQKDEAVEAETVAPRVRARATRRAPGSPPKPSQERMRMPRILRSSRQSLKHMSVADAARQLDGEDGVVLFRNAETETISVLYRAASGELTLVETE